VNLNIKNLISKFFLKCNKVRKQVIVAHSYRTAKIDAEWKDISEGCLDEYPGRL
jgi:hypothetical protein